MKFQKIPVDGSKGIDDTMMEAIEPYDYVDLKEFNLSYLSGYMADKYDQEPDDLTARVYERMEQSVREGFRDSVECYETVTTKKEKITVTNKGQVIYGLFPVWFVNTKWLWFWAASAVGFMILRNLPYWPFTFLAPEAFRVFTS